MFDWHSNSFSYKLCFLYEYEPRTWQIPWPKSLWYVISRTIYRHSLTRGTTCGTEASILPVPSTSIQYDTASSTTDSTTGKKGPPFRPRLSDFLPIVSKRVMVNVKFIQNSRMIVRSVSYLFAISGSGQFSDWQYVIHYTLFLNSSAFDFKSWKYLDTSDDVFISKYSELHRQGHNLALANLYEYYRKYR